MNAPSPSPVDRPEFRLGMRLHNDGEYYEAHEAWERVWRDEEDESHRRFVQGLIQITAGCHKAVVEGMPSSARKLVERGLEKLEPFDDVHLGVDLGAFRGAIRAWAASIAEVGADAETVRRPAKESVPRLTMRAG